MKYKTKEERPMKYKTKEERPMKYKTINKYQPEHAQVDTRNPKFKKKVGINLPSKKYKKIANQLF